MTTAAQRIWEAIYAAEFVRRAQLARRFGQLFEADDVRIVADDAATFASWHTDIMHSKRDPVRPASRFRKRSR